jgi:hypothetical protein
MHWTHYQVPWPRLAYGSGSISRVGVAALQNSLRQRGQIRSASAVSRGSDASAKVRKQARDAVNGLG